MGCIYTDAKNYPREPAAHVAISKIALELSFCFRLMNFAFPTRVLCGFQELYAAF